MKKHPLFHAVLVLALAGWAGSAAAQAPTQVAAKMGKVQVNLQKTPLYTAANIPPRKEGRTRDWLEMEVEFETRSDSKIGIVPELMVTYYLAVDGVTPQILTDQITYTNVVDKESSFAVVYVSPAGLTRINGEMGKFKLTDVKAWGVEILYNGRVIATESSGGGDWWTRAQQPRVPGLITAKEDTPFSFLWIDRYLEQKR